MEKDRHLEHQEDIQQRYFHSNQPKSTENEQHQYPTRSKTSANEAKTTVEHKEFVFLRDKGEKVTLVFKPFEFILQDNFWEPRLDPQGKEIVVIDPPPNDIMGRVFLTKPDERGNMERARVVALINELDVNLTEIYCNATLLSQERKKSTKLELKSK